ncbi:MAG: 2Fe-2S iron-sulfur cluster-binding protein [Bacteroidota bacterium]
MIHISVTDRDGSKRSLEIKENPSGNLMEVLTEEQFDVPAICGGMAGCGTCHVSVVKGAEKLAEPEDDEEFMLDSLPNYIDTSRLSCQLPLNAALDGAEIEVMGDGM